MLQAAVAAIRPAVADISMLTPAAGIVFSSRLVGMGFHRVVQYSWTCDSAACKADVCSIDIIQPLPAALFADIYQLEDMARMGSSRADAVTCTATLLGSPDLEGTSMESRPVVLVVQASRCIGYAAADQPAIIPLHARYAMPVNQPRPSSRFKYILSPTTSIAMPPATVLLSTANESVRHDTAESVSLWELPTGQVSHRKPVEAATFIAVTFSCAFVLRGAGQLQTGC